MAQIKVTDLSFAYPGSYDNIFEQASFQFDSDWKLGFIGRNGRGKTTFLKLLMGEYPSEGRIDAPMDFDYFPFAVPHPGHLAGEVCAKIDPDVPSWRLAREMAALSLGEELLWRPFDTLSKGRADQAAAGAALRAGKPLSADRRADQPPRHPRPRAGQPLPERQKGLYPRQPRPRLPRRLRGPHPVDQPRGYRGAARELFHLVGKQAAAGCL